MNVTRTRRLSSLLCTTVFALAAQHAFAAYNPMDPASEKTLPDTRPIYEYAPTNATSASGLPRSTSPLPLYPARTIVMPSAPVLAPAKIAPMPAAKVAAAPPLPAFPPVEANVAARAQAQMAQTAPIVLTPPAQNAPMAGFIAPAPLIAPVTASAPLVVAPAAPQGVATAPIMVTPKKAAPVVAQAPAPSPAPIIAAPIVAAPMVVAAAPNELPPEITAPAQPLSTQSKNILSRVPSHIDTAKRTKTARLNLQRVSPDVDAVLGKDAAEQKYESVGLSIKVRRPGLDANYELNRAYTALMGGDTENAVQIYKDIISTQPNNQDALFGLAATYHRQGDLDHARPLYGRLLKINPNHREGLNNFLALISDESPQEALAELERLEQRNPDFSPIPAQEAIVLDKLGYVQESRAKMLRAIDLAPENLSYKYNLAVMSDRNGNFADASALYRLLIDAGLKGENLPAPLAELQKRLNFITSTAAAQGKAVGG